MKTRVKTSSEIEAMRESGRMTATILRDIARSVDAGMTTKEVADRVASELKKLGGRPSFLGYQGFPDVICISLNDEVVHGIPNARRILSDGDIASFDFGVTYRGMITDAAVSLIIGKPASPKHKSLLQDTRRSLYAGIDVIGDKVRTGDVGAAIEAVLKPGGYGIVRDLVGHGVGHQVHEEPNVPNYGSRHTGEALSVGMAIAIEPMVTLGSDAVYLAPDGWTVKTIDGSRAAHFEHTVLIVENGAEILTEL